MRIFRRSFLALALSVFAWLHGPIHAQVPATPASMVVGVIKASNVRGDVRRVNLANLAEAPLQNGDTLTQDNAIVTGTGESSAVLVFANGSTVRVGHTSRIEIKEFLMDPLQADVPSVAALTREPTKSRTNLRLEYGEMVGNVKTLNHADGSTFSVSTPAGAAGIRGTTFRIVYRPTGNGQAFNFQLSTAEGVVVFQGTTAIGRTEVPVVVGREVSFTATIDPADNSLVISPPGGGPGTGPGGGPRDLPPSEPISGEAMAALQDATVQIIQVQQQTRFTQVEVQSMPAAPSSTTPQGTPAQPGQPGQPAQPGAANSTTPTLAPTRPAETQRPPTPAAFPPRTTPGDGR